MTAACPAHIPVERIPAHVAVIRDGRFLTPSYLRAGDRISVRGGARFSFSYRGNRYTVRYGDVAVGCRRVVLSFGHIEVRAGHLPRTAVVRTREMLAFATVPGTEFVVTRHAGTGSTSARSLAEPIVAASASHQSLRISAQVTYTAIADRAGLRLDIWPFPISPLQRPATPADALPPYWADGLPCSVGCTPPGVLAGWPLQPFHEQHALRAGINELRPSGFHVAVDIQARNFQPVYAIQSGYAHIRYRGTGDVNVDVGNFFYWHIRPTVREGQYVVAYRTMIGRVLRGFYHLAFSELSNHVYLNPLRPGGSLMPYTDTEPPVIGVPQIFPDGRVTVAAFDPQSFAAIGLRNETPVLAPSSLAWRLYDSRGQALTGLEWAMRGSQNYPPALKRVIFAPGAANPGFLCFLAHRRCTPNWVYWLAGGLTQPLPLSSLHAGRYRLTTYAWDWKGNTSALDYWLTLPLAHSASASTTEFAPLAPRFDYEETGAPTAPPTASLVGP